MASLVNLICHIRVQPAALSNYIHICLDNCCKVNSKRGTFLWIIFTTAASLKAARSPGSPALGQLPGSECGGGCWFTAENWSDLVHTPPPHPSSPPNQCYGLEFSVCAEIIWLPFNCNWISGDSLLMNTNHNVHLWLYWLKNIRRKWAVVCHIIKPQIGMLWRKKRRYCFN